jgi:monoamine oxidase
MPLNRRQLLSAGATIAALGLPRRSRAASPEVDVVIVGAGLSGLNAAMLLTELGARVVVLEADSRSGGRCLTMDAWHLAPDLGGAQVGTDYARVLDVAGRLGVRLGPGAHINAPYAFVVDDTLVPASQWAQSPLNRTVGAERAVGPHALGGHYVEGRTPFESLDG